MTEEKYTGLWSANLIGNPKKKPYIIRILKLWLEFKFSDIVAPLTSKFKYIIRFQEYFAYYFVTSEGTFPLAIVGKFRYYRLNIF